LAPNQHHSVPATTPLAIGARCSEALTLSTPLAISEVEPGVLGWCCVLGSVCRRRAWLPPSLSSRMRGPRCKEADSRAAPLPGTARKQRRHGACPPTDVLQAEKAAQRSRQQGSSAPRNCTQATPTHAPRRLTRRRTSPRSSRQLLLRPMADL
jgi:hypothetical protein